MSTRSKALDAGRRAASVGDKAASEAVDRCRVLKKLFTGFAALFAKNRYVTFVISLFPFCFAAGLLAYTENNKMHTVAGGDVVVGFGPTPTAWRQALTLIVIFTFLIGSLGLIFKSQNMVAVCGVLQKWCAVAIFVVGSFDKETADLYCVENPDACDPAAMTGVDANKMINNLYIAPWLDYICSIIFFCSGAVLRQHALLIQEEADQAHAAAGETAVPYAGA